MIISETLSDLYTILCCCLSFEIISIACSVVIMSQTVQSYNFTFFVKMMITFVKWWLGIKRKHTQHTPCSPSPHDVHVKTVYRAGNACSSAMSHTETRISVKLSNIITYMYKYCWKISVHTCTVKIPKPVLGGEKS